jgi:hypothetical protein
MCSRKMDGDEECTGLRLFKLEIKTEIKVWKRGD